MTCKNCGWQLSEEDRFCKKCGTPVTDNQNVQIKKQGALKSKKGKMSVSFAVVMAALLVCVFLFAVLLGMLLADIKNGSEDDEEAEDIWQENRYDNKVPNDEQNVETVPEQSEESEQSDKLDEENIPVDEVLEDVPGEMTPDVPSQTQEDTNNEETSENENTEVDETPAESTPKVPAESQESDNDEEDEENREIENNNVLPQASDATVYSEEGVMRYIWLQEPKNEVVENPYYVNVVNSEFSFAIDCPEHFIYSNTSSNSILTTYFSLDGSAAYRIGSAYNEGGITAASLCEKMKSIYPGEVTYNPVKDEWFAISTNDGKTYHYAFYRVSHGVIKGFEFHYSTADAYYSDEELNLYKEYIDHIYDSLNFNYNG